MAEENTESSAEPKAGGKKGNVWKKYKWPIVIGGLVLVMLFFFLRKNSAGSSAGSQSASSTDPATGYPYGSPADIAALNGSGMYQPIPQGGSDSGGLTGATGATGATGPAGPAGPAGSPGLPGYGQAGPAQNGFQAIPVSIANVLNSKKNKFNPQGGRAQRPYIWNGSAYVPVTNITAGQQYYSGPLESKEISNYRVPNPGKINTRVRVKLWLTQHIPDNGEHQEIVLSGMSAP